MNMLIAMMLLSAWGAQEERQPPALPGRIMERIDPGHLRVSVDTLAAFGTPCCPKTRTHWIIAT